MEWERIVSTLGFPIFVAVYFMIRTEKIISEFTASNKELTIVIKQLKHMVGELKGGG